MEYLEWSSEPKRVKNRLARQKKCIIAFLTYFEQEHYIFLCITFVEYFKDSSGGAHPDEGFEATLRKHKFDLLR